METNEGEERRGEERRDRQTDRQRKMKRDRDIQEASQN